MQRLLLLAFSCSFPLAALSAESPWRRHVIDDSLRGADGVRLADFDGDGQTDIVTGWEESGVIRLYLNPGSQPGVWWLPEGGPAEAIESPPGGKFDLIECLDIDGDGDADVLTCEERQNLGVVWYENPGY